MTNLCVVEVADPNLILLADVILTWSGKRNDILEDEYTTAQIDVENQKRYDEYRAQKRKKR